MLFLSSSARDYLPAVDTIKRKEQTLFGRVFPTCMVDQALIEEYGEERACAIFRSLYRVINPVFV